MVASLSVRHLLSWHKVPMTCLTQRGHIHKGVVIVGKRIVIQFESRVWKTGEWSSHQCINFRVEGMTTTLPTACGYKRESCDQLLTTLPQTVCDRCMFRFQLHLSIIKVLFEFLDCFLEIGIFLFKGSHRFLLSESEQVGCIFLQKLECIHNRYTMPTK